MDFLPELCQILRGAMENRTQRTPAVVVGMMWLCVTDYAWRLKPVETQCGFGDAS